MFKLIDPYKVDILATQQVIICHITFDAGLNLTRLRNLPRDHIANVNKMAY